MTQKRHDTIRKIRKTFQIGFEKYLHSLILDYIRCLKNSREANLEEKKKKLLQYFLPDPSMNHTSPLEFNYVNNLFWDRELYIYSNLHCSLEN